MTKTSSSFSRSQLLLPISWSAISRLIRLQNQTGTWLLMLPSLWSLALAAGGLPPLHLFIIFVSGSFFMRSAGVTLNDLADCTFDQQMSRTRGRPLASGELTTRHAFLVILFFIFLAGILVFFLNSLTVFLSPIAILLACLYPFSKRFIHVPQVILGVAFGWGTIMAWAASRGVIEEPAWCLFAATICWAIGYDTIYALQDEKDDRRIGVKSSAVLFGAKSWIAIATAFLGMLILLGVAGWLTHIGWVYYVTLIGIGVWCLKQALQLREPVPMHTALRMFQQHVWLGVAVFASMIVGFLF